MTSTLALKGAYYHFAKKFLAKIMQKEKKVPDFLSAVRNTDPYLVIYYKDFYMLAFRSSGTLTARHSTAKTTQMRYNTRGKQFCYCLYPAVLLKL